MLGGDDDAMMIVMGAGGNTGNKIAMTLLAAGHPVRALGRTRARLTGLERAGAEVMLGDTSEAGFLTRAFDGAVAAYTLLPTDQSAPDYPASQRREGEAIAAAVRESGVRHVVALSSLGADKSSGHGVIAGLHEQEERLKRIQGLNLLLLRPVSFFENFYGQLPVVKHQGVVADSVVADLPIPMIASRDVAAVAATALAARDWRGLVVRELLGQRDLSYRKATRILGERIGRPDLPYVQLPYDEMADALVGAGLSASFASRYVEMTRAFNEGTVGPQTGRTHANTTTTRFEDFAAELAHAYDAA